MTLIDLDHVAESNINRQIQATDETLGMAKVTAMARRITAIQPDCHVNEIEEFITPENVASILPDCDAVIDAIDQDQAKAALIATCVRRERMILATGGAGGRIDPTRVMVDDLARTVQDALASKVRATLRKHYGFTRDPKRKFGIECVYSPEQLRRPESDKCEATVLTGTSSAPQGLSCAGYGSSVAVTATFGMTAAARVIGQL